MNHMDRALEAKKLALARLDSLIARVKALGESDDNYAVLRNTQCTVEALIETLEPDQSIEIFND